MDTDSAYLALSKPSIEEVVKPELRPQFEAVKYEWFMNCSTPVLAAETLIIIFIFDIPQHTILHNIIGVSTRFTITIFKRIY